MNLKAKPFFYNLDYYVKKSIDFIQEHEPLDGYFVGFSGGKDSIVTLDLVKKSGVKFKAYYSCTGIDPPVVVKFIRKEYPEVKFLYPKYSFWEGIRRKGVPLRTTRWCCDILKKNPSNSIPQKTRIMGIRGEESFSRKRRGMISNFKKRKEVYLHPIFEWKEWQIWDYIEENKLVYPSLYDEGFSRIGCIICPFIKGKTLELYRNRWPSYFKVFEKVVKEWFTPNKFIDIDTPEQFLDYIYKNKFPDKNKKGFFQ